MADIFGYTHFGPYLKDWYSEQKSLAGLSLQEFSTAIGLRSRSMVHKLMNHPKATISQRLCDTISRYIGHNKQEREYFSYLARFSRSRTADEKGMLYGKMHRMLSRLRPKYLEHWQLDFFVEWYNPAIRELVDCKPKPRSYEEIAHRLHPSATPTQVRKSIELLLLASLLKIPVLNTLAEACIR